MLFHVRLLGFRIIDTEISTLGIGDVVTVFLFQLVIHDTRVIAVKRVNAAIVFQ